MNLRLAYQMLKTTCLLWLLAMSGQSLAVDTDNDGIDDSIDACPQQSGISDIEPALGTQPDITFLEFCTGQTSDGGPALFFKIKLSASFSNSSSIQLLYWLVGNHQTWITIPRNASTGDFELQRELNQYAVGGAYSIRQVRITDNTGLTVKLNESQLTGLGFNVSTTLTNPQSDNDDPYVMTLTTSGWSINNDVPEITFQLEAADDLSGLQAGYITELNSPSGSSIQKWGYFDGSGVGSTTHQLSKYAASGTYTINTIRLYDNAGNSNFSQSWIASNPTDFVLQNPNQDSIPPDIQSFSLSAEFDDAANRPIIKVSGLATDSPAGVKGILLRLDRPEGGLFDNWLFHTHGEGSGSQVISNTLPLTTQFVSGTYGVNYLRLTDSAENEKYFSSSDLNTKDLSSGVNVFFPTEQQVESGTTTVNASSADDYVFGANNSDDTISAGDGNDYIYSGSGDDNVDAGSGDDQVIGGSGAGDDTYRGGSGFDSLIYSSASNGLEIDLPNQLATGQDIDRDTITGFENIISGSGPDVITGDSYSNTIDGGSGNDQFYINPGGGIDNLIGGIGDDAFVLNVLDSVGLQSVTLNGGSGADVFNISSIGPAGSDEAVTITGGSGADIYRPTNPNLIRNLVLTDFSPSQGDIIDLSAFLAGNSVSLADISANPALIDNIIVLTNSGSNTVLRWDKGIVESGISSTVDVITFNNSPNLSDGFDYDGDGVASGDTTPFGGFGITDTDGDGLSDDSDTFPSDSSEWLDTDSDGIGNNADADDDGDGVDDASDAFPLDSAEQIDSDGDGTGNNADTDDDNDGVNDSSDTFPLNATETIDTDSDGIGNNTDTDDDDDGLSDSQEATFGTNPIVTDTDGDDYSDKEEVDYETDPLDRNSYPILGGLNLTLIKAVLDKRDQRSD